MTMAELEVWMHQLGDRVDLGIARKMGRAASEIGKELFKRTPVLTGRARSGWVITLDSPSSDIPAVGHTIEAEAAVVTSSVSSARTIYIVNNVPYIGILNAGSSRQAPAHFVEAAIRAGSRAVRDVRIL